MTVLVKNILLSQGPMRSARLAETLSKLHGLSDTAARKQISRARYPVMRFPIRLLPKKEAFLYIEDDRNTDRFWAALLSDLRASGSVYGLALDGLLARGGIAQRSSFGVVSGSPVAQAKQVPLSGVIDNLENARLIRRDDVGEMGECLLLHPDIFDYPDMHAFRARSLAEGVLMDALREWTRRLGLASYDAIAIRKGDDAPRFSTFFWDLCGPSYLMPLVSIKQGKRTPGFFVADVFCDRTLSLDDIQYYLRKVRVLRSMKRVRPFLPVLLADGYDKDALLAGKSVGIVMATTRNLFGEAIADALRSLLDTLTRSAAIAAKNPDKVFELLSSLSAVEGAAGNLRGALFEMIVGYLVCDVEGHSIDIGEIIYDPKTGKQAEIDVRRLKGRQECWSYECRARQPNHLIGAEEVKTWLIRVDRIHRFHRAEDRFQGCTFGFELWTTGGFDVEALTLLKREKAKRRKISLGWRDGPSVRDYAKRAKRKAVLDSLDEHYFNHPLS